MSKPRQAGALDQHTVNHYIVRCTTKLKAMRAQVDFTDDPQERKRALHFLDGACALAHSLGLIGAGEWSALTSELSSSKEKIA